jgi:hypothetical protein
MLIEKLPLELVQYIIELVLRDNNRKDFYALLGVNRILGKETIVLHLRPSRSSNSEADRWNQLPLHFCRRMAQENVMGGPDPGTKRSIATYMHAVVRYLELYSKAFDPEHSGLMSRDQWLHEICNILALHGADCKYGKPAFKHTRCHNLAYQPDTAFHLAILKRYTILEKAIIDDGRSWNSVCP